MSICLVIFVANWFLKLPSSSMIKVTSISFFCHIHNIPASASLQSSKYCTILLYWVIPFPDFKSCIFKYRIFWQVSATELTHPCTLQIQEFWPVWATELVSRGRITALICPFFCERPLMTPSFPKCHRPQFSDPFPLLSSSPHLYSVSSVSAVNNRLGGWMYGWHRSTTLFTLQPGTPSFCAKHTSIWGVEVVSILEYEREFFCAVFELIILLLCGCHSLKFW